MAKHVHGRPDNQDENLDDILGRGKGDGDAYGYPGQELPKPKEFDANSKHPKWVAVDLKPIHWSEMEALKPKQEQPKTEFGDIF